MDIMNILSMTGADDIKMRARRGEIEVEIKEYGVKSMHRLKFSPAKVAVDANKLGVSEAEIIANAFELHKAQLENRES